MTYRIRDWDKHFENNKSRERDRCSYVCVPNKQDGMGLTRILAEPDGAAIYGIWQLILGAVSRQSRPRAGWLTDDGQETGTAWAPEDMALRWRRTEQEISRALDVLCSPAIGWIECPSGVFQVPAECPSGALEGKGKEGKGKERKVNASGDMDGEITGETTEKPRKNPSDDFAFDAWWKRYPRKISKGAARSAWAARMREGIEVQVLEGALTNYLEEIRILGTEERFMKHPATFLGKQKGFEDFLPGTWKPPAKAQTIVEEAGYYPPFREDMVS